MSLSDSMKERIRSRYPFPISHAYTYLESRVDAQDCYAALLNCFEATLKTITSIALANLVQDIQEDSTLGNVHIFQTLVDRLRRPMSRGHWLILLRRTLRPYYNRREG